MTILVGVRAAVVGVSAERSIGFAAARMLRSLGADVAVTSRPERSETVAALAASIGASHVVLDVDRPESIGDAIDVIGRQLGGLDAVVHTLMHVPPGLLDRPLTELPADGFHRVMEVGVWSLIALARQARPLLARSPAPRLIAIGSPCGHRMTPHYHVAGIAKAALESTVLYLAHELGPAGILCNAVSPGLIDTDGAVAVVGPDVAAATRAHLARKAATRKAVDLDDVARAIAWLASPLASNMTGEVITIDGGHARAYF
jgi:enoyl-[acyl-carrier protein] reductase I